jgi:hypothetical protein
MGFEVSDGDSWGGERLSVSFGLGIFGSLDFEFLEGLWDFGLGGRPVRRCAFVAMESWLGRRIELRRTAVEMNWAKGCFFMLLNFGIFWDRFFE